MGLASKSEMSSLYTGLKICYHVSTTTVFNLNKILKLVPLKVSEAFKRKRVGHKMTLIAHFRIMNPYQ